MTKPILFCQREYENLLQNLTPESIEKIKMIGVDSQDRFFIRKPYKVVNGNAIIEIRGAIQKDFSWWMFFIGGTSTELLKEQLLEASKNPSVTRIILDVNSGGGSATDIDSLSTMIYELREQIEIISFVSMAASAAYYIASAAHKVYLMDNMSEVGSIGVVATHIDVSELEKQRGVKTTEITAGKYKRIASYYGPLSEEGRKYMEKNVQEMYEVFTKAVARNLNKDHKYVLDNIAEGQLFSGQKAVDLGMAHEIMSIDKFLQDSKGESTLEYSEITMQSLAENRKDLVKEIGEKAVKEASLNHLQEVHGDLFESAKKEASEISVKSERERISKIMSFSCEGFEDVQKKSIDSGDSYEQFCVKYAEESSKRGANLNNIKKDSPDPISGNSGGEDLTEEDKSINMMVEAMNRSNNNV